MASNRLNIVSVSRAPDPTQNPLSTRLLRKKELQAKFERLWLINPDQFDPLRNCMEKERLKRTWDMLLSRAEVENKEVVDIGCGAGFFTRRLRDAGAKVTAVDIAENALKQLRKNDMSNITAMQDAMPMTSLPDDTYDIVICLEVIAELPRDEYRLFFSELNRIVKPGGWILCSTAVDIDSDDAAHQLFEFAVTELEIIDVTYSYHALYLRLKHFFQAPQKFISGWKSCDDRNKTMSSLSGFHRLWYTFNSSSFVAWAWVPISFVARPILKILKTSRSFMMLLEKTGRFFGPESHISHVIFLAKRKPIEQFETETPPIERRKKREVWE